MPKFTDPGKWYFVVDCLDCESPIPLGCADTGREARSTALSGNLRSEVPALRRRWRSFLWRAPSDGNRLCRFQCSQYGHQQFGALDHGGAAPTGYRYHRSVSGREKIGDRYRFTMVARCPPFFESDRIAALRQASLGPDLPIGA